MTLLEPAYKDDIYDEWDPNPTTAKYKDPIQMPDKPTSTSHTPDHINFNVEAATEEGHIAVMIALRKTIAARIDEGCASRDLAALSRRLIEIDREIRELSTEEDDPVAAALNS